MEVFIQTNFGFDLFGVKVAVDGGLLNERVGDLQVELAEARSERDAWRIEAMRAQCA